MGVIIPITMGKCSMGSMSVLFHSEAEKVTTIFPLKLVSYVCPELENQSLV